MAKIHHNTTKKFDLLAAEHGVTATLHIGPNGNPELVWDDRVFESEDARELVEALRGELEGDEEVSPSLEELEVEQTGDDEEEGRGDIVKPRYKARYKAHNDTCGDVLAKVLQEACNPGGQWSEENFLTICGDNGIVPKWSGNNGQRKMCLSNMLRARLRKGHNVTVLNQELEGEKQEEQGE